MNYHIYFPDKTGFRLRWNPASGISAALGPAELVRVGHLYVKKGYARKLCQGLIEKISFLKTFVFWNFDRIDDKPQIRNSINPTYPHIETIFGQTKRIRYVGIAYRFKFRKKIKPGYSCRREVMMASFQDRIIRAAKLDVNLYEEVEADKGALGQAMGVVVLSAWRLE